MTGALPAYPTFGEWSRLRYGSQVRKVMVNAGFTCPNRDGRKGVGGCIYCNNAAFSPLLEGSVKEQALKQIGSMKKPPHNVIVYFQPFSNTYAPAEKLRRIYAEALEVPGVVAIAIGTRPDCIDTDVMTVIDEISQRVDVFLEIGVQSANDGTLARINRGHTWAGTEAAFKLVASHQKILTVAHLIIGLPGENRADMLATAKAVANLRPHGIKLHHLHVVKDTKLAEEYAAGRVKMLTADEYVPLAVETIKAFPPDTVLHRLMGETLGRSLIAPRWAESKQEISSRILAGVRS